MKDSVIRRAHDAPDGYAHYCMKCDQKLAKQSWNQEGANDVVCHSCGHNIHDIKGINSTKGPQRVRILVVTIAPGVIQVYCPKCKEDVKRMLIEP